MPGIFSSMHQGELAQQEDAKAVRKDGLALFNKVDKLQRRLSKLATKFSELADELDELTSEMGGLDDRDQFPALLKKRNNR